MQMAHMPFAMLRMNLVSGSGLTFATLFSHGSRSSGTRRIQTTIMGTCGSLGRYQTYAGFWSRSSQIIRKSGDDDDNDNTGGKGNDLCVLLVRIRCARHFLFDVLSTKICANVFFREGAVVRSPRQSSCPCVRQRERATTNHKDMRGFGGWSGGRPPLNRV